MCARQSRCPATMYRLSSPMVLPERRSRQTTVSSTKRQIFNTSPDAARCPAQGEQAEVIFCILRQVRARQEKGRRQLYHYAAACGPLPLGLGRRSNAEIRMTTKQNTIIVTGASQGIGAAVA